MSVDTRPDDWPVIVADPRYRFGRTRVGHTTTEDIAGMIMAGELVDVVCEEHELTRHQVLLACWHEAVNGGNTRRRRLWREWANDAHQMLGGWVKPFNLDAIPDPPTAIQPPVRQSRPEAGETPPKP